MSSGKKGILLSLAALAVISLFVFISWSSEEKPINARTRVSASEDAITREDVKAHFARLYPDDILDVGGYGSVSLEYDDVKISGFRVQRNYKSGTMKFTDGRTMTTVAMKEYCVAKDGRIFELNKLNSDNYREHLSYWVLIAK